MFINNTVFLNKMNYNLKKDSPINTLDKIISDANYNRAIQKNFDRAEFKKDITSNLKKTEDINVSIEKSYNRIRLSNYIENYIENERNMAENFKNTLIEYDRQIANYESDIKEGKGTPLIEKSIESLKSQKQEYFDKEFKKLEYGSNYIEKVIPIMINIAVYIDAKEKGSSVYTEYKDMIYEDKNGKKYVNGKVCVLNKKFYQDFDMSCFNNFADTMKEILKKDSNDEDFYSSLDSYIASIGRAKSAVANIFSKLK